MKPNPPESKSADLFVLFAAGAAFILGTLVASQEDECPSHQQPKQQTAAARAVTNALQLLNR